MKKFKIMFSLLALAIVSPAFASWTFVNNTSDGNLWLTDGTNWKYVGDSASVSNAWNVGNGDNISVYYSDGMGIQYSNAATTTLYDGMTITATGSCDFKLKFLYGFCDNNNNWDTGISGSLAPDLNFGSAKGKVA